MNKQDCRQCTPTFHDEPRQSRILHIGFQSNPKPTGASGTGYNKNI
jgi:hypothetical protein